MEEPVKVESIAEEAAESGAIPRAAVAIRNEE